jgi:hypothetical protein
LPCEVSNLAGQKIFLKVLDLLHKILYNKTVATKTCKQIRAPIWVRISLSIDPEVWRKFKAKAEEMGEKNMSSLVESLMVCYTYETCEECPSYQDLPEEEKAKVKGKAGIVGKWEMREEEAERQTKISPSFARGKLKHKR